MGTTFINLQLNKKLEDIPAEAVPQGYFCKQTAEHWTAVFAENRETAWDKLPALGKKLSKALAVTVIAVDFFDDDVFSMTLFQNGRTVGAYYAEAARSRISGSEKWIKALSLSGEAAAAFRYLVKKEMTAEESIYAFSRLLGARLYDAPGLTEEDAALWRGDADGIVREMKAEHRKIKNGMKAVLLQEIPGLYHSCDWQAGVIRMVYPDEKGNFEYGHIHCLACTGTQFAEVHDYRYPPAVFGEKCKNLWLDYDNGIVHVMVLDQPIYYEDYDLDTYEAELCALASIPKEKLLQNAAVNLFPIYFYSTPTLCDGRYEYFTWSAGGELQKIDRKMSGKGFLQRHITASYRYESLDVQKEFWDCAARSVCAFRNGILHVRLKYIREPENIVCDIRFFDRDLKLLRQEEILLNETYHSFGGNAEYAYCEKTDCIYMGNLKIDLQTHEIKRGDAELKEAAKLLVKPEVRGGRLYAVRGSYLLVFDLDMKLISGHRLKGHIFAGYWKGENLCLITENDSLWDDRIPDKTAAVRVYEIAEEGLSE